MNLVFVEYREPFKSKPPFLSTIDSFKSHPESFKIIALTPYTVDQFIQAEFYDFEIPEKYYLWQETSSYSIWFQEWLERLEQIVISYHPFFAHIDIPITTHCLTMLKNVMDAYVRTALQYFKIIRDLKPKKITILTDDAEIVDRIDDELYFKFPSVYFQLTGKEFKISFSGEYYYQKDWREIAEWIRCLQFIPSWKRNKSLLFAAPMSEKIREAKLKGFKTEILHIPHYEHFSYFQPSPPISLFQSIDKEFDFPPFTSQNILWPRIKYFLVKIIAEIKLYAEYYEKYFRENEFSCLVFNRRNHPYQYGALIAARKMGLKTIYIRHGWDAYDDNKLWWRPEQRLRPFDYFVCPNKLDQEYYTALGNKYGCKII
jgi:hypothetical protein